MEKDVTANVNPEDVTSNVNALLHRYVDGQLTEKEVAEVIQDMSISGVIRQVLLKNNPNQAQVEYCDRVMRIIEKVKPYGLAELAVVTMDEVEKEDTDAAEDALEARHEELLARPGPVSQQEIDTLFYDSIYGLSPAIIRGLARAFIAGALWRSAQKRGEET